MLYFAYAQAVYAAYAYAYICDLSMLVRYMLMRCMRLILACALYAELLIRYMRLISLLVRYMRIRYMRLILARALYADSLYATYPCLCVIC